MCSSRARCAATSSPIIPLTPEYWPSDAAVARRSGPARTVRSMKTWTAARHASRSKKSSSGRPGANEIASGNSATISFRNGITAMTGCEKHSRKSTVRAAITEARLARHDVRRVDLHAQRLADQIHREHDGRADGVFPDQPADDAAERPVDDFDHRALADERTGIALDRVGDEEPQVVDLAVVDRRRLA